MTMKKLLFILFLLFAVQHAKADTTTIYFSSTVQPVQNVTLNSCDTLLIVNTSGNTYLVHDDTTAQGFPGTIIATGTGSTDSAYLDLSAYDFVVITHQASTILFYVTIAPPPQQTLSETICNGESYLFDGIARTTTGIYTMTTPSPNTPCDSVITLNLTVLPPITTVTNDVQICPGNSYTLNGVTYVNPGYYPLDTLTAANGCDSILQLHLTWTAILPGNSYVTICTGQSYTFDGEEYTESGTYTAFLQTPAGCDSIAILNLTVLPPIETYVNATICPGESYNLGGTDYSQSGTYTYTYELPDGCDSNVVLSLHVESSYIEIYQFDANTLYAASPVTVYFQWMNCTSGFVYEDETGSTFTPSQNGLYAVIATENGCPDTSECLPISAIGLTENTAADYFVFPVPSDETVTISTDAGFTGSAFTIVSPAGITVLEGRIDSPQTTVSIARLAAGTYFVRVDGSEIVTKIVRE
jgi:hypothetical protein